MIARHEGPQSDIWARLSAPLPTGSISWRQDGKAVARDGGYVARFVAYVDAQTVRERLDLVVPGEWDLTLYELPVAGDEDGVATIAFKARIQILGVIREDVGQGRDYKSAATDAFKRAAMRFGIAHELYDFEQNWVRVDSDSKYAKPLEDPAVVYARKVSGVKSARREESTATAASGESPQARQQPAPAPEPELATNDGPLALDEPSCPKCGGRMWDNRLSKKNPKAPDYKCRNRSCEGVIWPPKPSARPVPVPDDDAPPPDDADMVPF